MFAQSVVLPLVGVVCGLAAAFLADGREKERRSFVAEVEGCRVAGYRVDATREGKVLVQITPPDADAYRTAEGHDAVVELDQHGDAVRRIG